MKRTIHSLRRTALILSAASTLLAVGACSSMGTRAPGLEGYEPGLGNGSSIGISGSSGSGVQMYGTADVGFGTTRVQGPGGTSRSTGLR